MRDETHRFAITFHRGKRDKRVFESVLDTIPGIGPERRARLLRTYGSVKAMRGVKAEELASKGRLPKLVAKKLFKALNANQFE